MASFVKNVATLLYQTPGRSMQINQVRHKFADSRMVKDYRKRLEVKKYGKERLRINALRKNKILPPELQALADEEIASLPRQSSMVQLVKRCALTSRARGSIAYFRVSRIMFRHFADYNKLAGVQRAMW
ncbi:hypothetical protein RUM44_003907 [Polyplax serrata]|uniref:Small ribosomal subunit protein uS14 n=1 Tax=Polyplax serrata TaxID=468196 RepID=A0ABR1B1C1_POLSC